MAAEPLDRDTLEAAARWYVELRCGGDDTLRAAHQRWLSSNPQHLLAWERLARLQGKLAQVTPGIARPTLTSARAKRREVLKVLSVLLVGSATGGVVLQDGIVARLTADVRTGVGQQRSLRLDDGTQLRLNTDTAVDIRYNGEWRALELLKGEILVQTASDALSRPFVVHTGQGSVRALGTRFIVRCDNDLVRVCVLQHAVEVRSALAMASVRVEAGQQLEFSAGKTGNVTPLAAMADAWSREMLSWMTGASPMLSANCSGIGPGTWAVMRPWVGCDCPGRFTWATSISSWKTSRPRCLCAFVASAATGRASRLPEA